MLSSENDRACMWGKLKSISSLYCSLRKEWELINLLQKDKTGKACMFYQPLGCEYDARQCNKVFQCGFGFYQNV